MFPRRPSRSRNRTELNWLIVMVVINKGDDGDNSIDNHCDDDYRLSVQRHELSVSGTPSHN